MFGGEGAAGTEAQSVGEIGRSEGTEWAEAVNGTLECERPHCRPRGTERRRGARWCWKFPLLLTRPAVTRWCGSLVTKPSAALGIGCSGGGLGE